MQSKTYNLRQWNVPRELQRTHGIADTQRLLAFFNRVSNENFYVIDFYTRKIIVGESYHPTLCGLPKKFIQKKGFDLLDVLFPKKGVAWHREVFEKVMDISASGEPKTRPHWEVTYALVSKNEKDEDILLQHRIIPFVWDASGNLWRAILKVWVSPAEMKAGEVQMVNRLTGEIHNYIDGKFRKAKVKLLTDDEIQMLELLAKDVSCKQLMEQLNLTPNAFSIQKKSAFKKLGVKTQAGAVAKAMTLGYIHI